jgi:hypothetical protein
MAACSKPLKGALRLLFEFKVVELVPQGKALEQIRQRGYADKYRSQGEPIHLIGVEFSKQQRSVVGFEVESIDLHHFAR